MHTALIVDDIQEYRHAFENCLRALNFDVIQAYDGVNAMECLGSQPIDLIFLDYYMPRMNGFQVLDRLAEDDELSNIPVVMTSSDIMKNKLAVAQYGCVGYVRKPPLKDEVAHLIQTISFPRKR